MSTAHTPESLPVVGAGPSGLSDLAVSPLGIPVALLSHEVRVAVLCRTSTDEQQDPRQSLLRQINTIRGALPEAWVIVAYFTEVESGRMELADRGQGTNVHQRYSIPVPRDRRDHRPAGGGRRPRPPVRRGDLRKHLPGRPPRVRGPLGRAGTGTPRGGVVRRERADHRVRQPGAADLAAADQSGCGRVRGAADPGAVLVWAVHPRPGRLEHRQAAYGYRAATVRHPNPAKAARGHTKMRLEPDPATAVTVTQVAAWRYYEGLGYGAIAERLNADPDRFPPPHPGRWRAPGPAGMGQEQRLRDSQESEVHWLPGVQPAGVPFRAREGQRHRQWVWSTQPTHEPLIAKWMYDQIRARSQSGRGSRREARTATPRPGEPTSCVAWPTAGADGG